MTNTREELGPFVAAEFLQELRRHVEDLAGRSPIVGAGRLCGVGIVEHLGLLDSRPAPTEAQNAFSQALGTQGTQLAVIDEITEQDGTYTVRIHDGTCSYNRTSDKPLCSFTLGVFMGGLGALYGTTMAGEEVECEAMGSNHCIYKIRQLMVA